MTEIIKEAAWVVLLFDQANTNGTIEQLGSRGKILKSAVDDLRKVLSGNELVNRMTDDGKWSVGHGPN